MEEAAPHGSCLCGGVRFSAVLPANWVAHCHCTRCRRAHGAAFVTWVGFPETAVVVADDESLLRWHVASEGGSRGFCSRCGSPMFFQSARFSGEMHVARALFVEPVDLEPMAHAHHDTHVAWVSLADTLPTIDSD